MRKLGPIFCCFAILGCEPQKTVQQQTHKVHLVDATGKTKITDYNWQIIAEPGKPIDFQKLFDDDGGYSGTEDMTPPHPGWLVAIPSESYLWYFDGTDNGMLIHYTPEVSTVYGLVGAQARATPPKEFLERLPTQVRKSISAEQGAAANP